jgi:hypothetical protein
MENRLAGLLEEETPETNRLAGLLEKEPPEHFDPDEEERQIKEAVNISEEYGLAPSETMKLVAGLEPSLFRQQLHNIKEFIRERTGYFEPPIYGEKYREEKPFRTLSIFLQTKQWAIKI